jgi:hypothetical protein
MKSTGITRNVGTYLPEHAKKNLILVPTVFLLMSFSISAKPYADFYGYLNEPG